MGGTGIAIGDDSKADPIGVVELFGMNGVATPSIRGAVKCSVPARFFDWGDSL
jgi:hypothetical protein